MRSNSELRDKKSQLFNLYTVVETGFQFLQIDWLNFFQAGKDDQTLFCSLRIFEEKSLCHWPEIQTDWSIKESTASEIHNHYIHVSPNPSHEALLIRRWSHPAKGDIYTRERIKIWAYPNMLKSNNRHIVLCVMHTHSHGYIKVRKHDLSALSLDYGRWCAFLTRWGEHDRSGVKLGKCTLVKKLFKLITSSLRLPNCMMHEYSYT